MKGYKGFDKDLKCRDMQYEIGKTYEAPEAVLCEKGLHFCEHPLDCFGYYAPGDGSRYCEVEASGEIVTGEAAASEDTKRAATTLTIVRELTLTEMITAAACAATANHAEGDSSAASSNGYRSAASSNGYRSAASSNGYRSAASSNGDFSAASSNGDFSAASVVGKQSIACALGAESRARGALGCWIVVAERSDDDADYGNIITVKTAKVDGETIKADTWYTVRGEQWEECGDE